MLSIYLTIYENNDGQLIYRYTKNKSYDIDDITSYGWKVLDVQVMYNNRFISLKQYKKICYNFKKKRRTRNKVLRIIDIIFE